MLVRVEKTYPLGSANCCVWQEHCLGTARLDINVVIISIVTNSTDKYIDIIISQNTTQFYAQYVQYISQLHVSAHF